VSQSEVPMIRDVQRVLEGRETMDGAGVRLRRIFGFSEVPAFDPFLMLDDFGTDNADDFIAGFPMHPHRGIETVTYLIKGRVRHKDSLGNNGVIGPGDMQWMSAGSGIIHEEMPEVADGSLRGLQLWVNLPKSHKMSVPKYRDVVGKDVPVVPLAGGGLVRVLAGEYEGARGPIKDVVASPGYLDVEVPTGGSFRLSGLGSLTVFVYVLDGSVRPAPTSAAWVNRGSVVLYGAGDGVAVDAGPQGTRFVLAYGKPIGEPVAWRGPIVMNTPQELDEAFKQVRNGTFIQ